MLKRYSVLWFVVLTVVLSFGAYFLPLPTEQKSLLVPILLVLIPTLVCAPLAFFTEGKEGIRQLFSRVRGAWRWVLIGAVLGAMLRVAVWIAGTLLGTSIRADLSAPGTAFVILATIPLAWFEELGWRRFALDRLLMSRSPFEASLLLGVPWSLVHLVLLLPGMMSVGAPLLSQTLILIALSVFLTWVYVRSGGSLRAVTLLHGLQNGLVVLNRGLGIAEATWLMVGVYVIGAILLILFDRQT
ncbi:MAG TPA: CPBP family intramembrane glutamic endopeptidase, partial [Anaerolineales bacterium]|nr:CPBP family intramembrane glutamic endopeptidase [Anaerolineales bacterium]